MTNVNSITYHYFCDTISEVRSLIKSTPLPSLVATIHTSIDQLPTGRYEVFISLTYRVRNSDTDRE